MQIEKLKVHGTRPVGAAAESRDNQVHYGLAICAINMELAGNLSGAKLFVPKHDFHGSNSYRKNWLKKDKKSRSDYADTIIRPKITARI